MMKFRWPKLLCLLDIKLNLSRSLQILAQSFSLSFLPERVIPNCRAVLCRTEFRSGESLAVHGQHLAIVCDSGVPPNLDSLSMSIAQFHAVIARSRLGTSSVAHSSLNHAWQRIKS